MDAEESQTSDLNTLTPIQRRERILTLIVIAFVALLTGIDYAIILPTAWGYLNQYMHSHFAGFAMGILLSVFALSGAISGLILGHLNDLGVPLKRLLIVGGLFEIVGNFLYFVGINVYLIVFSRLIAGVGMGIAPPLIAEISRRSTPENRTQLLGKILGFRQLGLFLGPCFTILLKNFDFNFMGIHVTTYNGPGLVMTIFWIIQILLTVFLFYEAPENIKRIPVGMSDYSWGQICSNVGQICRNPVIIILLVTSFIAYFNQTTLETTLTPFTNYQFGWHELEVSILFAVAGVEIAIIYVILHFLSKKFSDQLILFVGYIILSIACLVAVIMLPFSSPHSSKLLPVFLLFVALDILALPLIVVTTTSLFTQNIQHEHQGIGQGIQRSIINIGTIVGPLYAGALLQSIWIMMFSMFIIVVIATVLIGLIYRRFRVKQLDETSALITSEN